MRNSNWRKCVLHADSRDVIKRIPDNSIDFILTDPPYNLGQHSTGNIPLPGRSAMNNDVAEWDMIDFNPEEWADEFIRILKPTGNLFIFTSYNQLGRWYNCLDHKFDTSNFMIWHKTNPAPKIFKAGFLNSCEMIFTCWNKKHTWNFISQAEMHNFIESPICMRPERLADPKHPAQKPVSILKKMIEIASNSDDIIFDPFMGVGSTGIAALELNRRFIGVELDKTYFDAAKRRIESVINKPKMSDLKSYNLEEDNVSGMMHEDSKVEQTTFFELEDFFNSDDRGEVFKGENIASGLSPIVKWPGGKEKELKHIIPNAPRFERFFEPFVGGGSVFMGITAKEYYINDFSSELIEMYRSIATSDSDFFSYTEAMDRAWDNAMTFFKNNYSLVETYIGYRDGLIGKEELKEFISIFCMNKEKEILDVIGDLFAQLPSVLLKEVQVNLFRKMVRMRELEIEKHVLPEKDVCDNIETAIKSAIYMNFRYLYNDKKITETNIKLHCALFYFMRNYAYSGMFRYSNKGEFNVPYGGIGYNSKYMGKKLTYYRSKPLLNHFANTHIYNLDFEDFLRETQPKEKDFVFLDPPYLISMSEYNKLWNEEKEKELCNFLDELNLII